MKDNPNLEKNNLYVQKILVTYQKYKSHLRLSKRTIEAFEYRYSLIDGKFHTLNVTGKRLGVTSGRAQQLVARVIHKINNIDYEYNQISKFKDN